ncbi:MAG: hypothetical protein JRF33_08420 [Deltaproteobacteria bacterium]|nr:hypothetical protein [Deltaproteobacteria bacterium]
MPSKTGKTSKYYRLLAIGLFFVLLFVSLFVVHVGPVAETEGLEIRAVAEDVPDPAEPPQLINLMDAQLSVRGDGVLLSFSDLLSHSMLSLADEDCARLGFVRLPVKPPRTTV